MLCISTLAESKINGQAFLLLPENEKLLKSLNLQYVFEIVILEKVKEVRQSNNFESLITNCSHAAKKICG